MAIENISFGKGLFNRTEKSKKQNKNVQVPEQMTTTKSNRKHVNLAPYLAAALMIPAGGATLTSCVEQTVSVDESATQQLLAELLKTQQESLKIQQQMLEYLQNNDSQNTQLMNLLKQMMEQNQQISNILSGIAGDVSQIAGAVVQISAMMETANANDEELLNKIDQIIAGQGSDSEKLQQLIDLNAEQNNWLANIFGLIETANQFDEKLGETLQNFYNDYRTNSDEFKQNDKDHTTMMNLIYEALLSNNEISTETLNAIKNIQNSNQADSAKLDAIIKLLESIDSKLDKLQAGIDNIGDNITVDNESLKDILTEFLNQYKADKITDHELLNNIVNAFNQSNINDQELLNKLNDIQAQIASGQLAVSEGIDKITDLLNQIKSSLDQIVSELQSIAEQLGDNFMVDGKPLAQLVKEFMEMYKAGTITTNGLLTEINNKIQQGLDNDNANNAGILAKLDEISQKISNGQMSIEEGMSNISDILNSINGNIQNISGQLSTISSQIDKGIDQLNKNHNETLDMLSNINSGIGSIDSKLNDIKANQEISNDKLTDISNKIDEANAQLGQINQKTISIDQLKEMLGPMFDEISNDLTIIGGNQVSIEDLDQLLDKYKTDLTTTNGLIENLTSVVRNLDLSVDMGEGFQGVIDAINDFKNQQAGTAEQQMAAYREIMAAIANLTSSVDALGATASEISTDLKAHMAQATDYGTLMTDYMLEVINGQKTSIDAMQEAADSYREYLTRAEQDRAQQIALLQAIVDKEVGTNGGGLTKEELEEVLSKYQINVPDYSEILDSIYDQLGKVITSDDLQNFYINTRPDLTTTNALIENLTSVLRNKDFTISGDVQVNMDQVEKILGDIQSLISNQQTPSADQITALIQLVTQIADSTSQGGDTTRTRAVASVEPQRTKKPAFDMEKLYANLNRLSIEAAKAQGKPATYYVNPEMFTLNA